MKEVITAERIGEARKVGLKSISVPPGALITPQARDDAKSYGIALVMAERPAPACGAANPAEAPGHVGRPNVCPPGLPSFWPPARPLRSVTGSAAQSAACGVEAASTPAVERIARHLACGNGPADSSDQPVNLPSKPVAAPSASVQPDGAALAAGVIARLVELLAPRGGLAAFPGLEATVAAVISEFLRGAQPAASDLAGAPGLDLIRLPGAAPEKRLPGEVEVEEVLPPGPDGPGVTRLTWADSTLAWTFEFDEVLVVTGGEVAVAGPASPLAGLVLTPGEALRVRAGTALSLTARGEANCLCSSWPAPK